MNQPKMKIAFVTPLMIIGGAETYVINKCTWLINKGFEVLVISEGGENVKNLPNGAVHILLPGISLPPMAFSNKSYKLFLKELVAILLDNKVDVIEANNSYPAVHTAAVYKDTKIPFCINILSELAYKRNPLLNILTKKVNELGLYYTLTSDMNQYIENVISRKLNPIIIPIPVKAICQDSISDGKYILSVCRLLKEKIYVKYLMMDFFSLLESNDAYNNYKLIIVGDGPEYDGLNALANDLNAKANKDIIQLKSTVIGDDLENLYKKCTLFVGMGTTLLLAASCAKPSIMAGFSPETNQFSWGFWGESELDADIIGVGDAKGRISSSFSSSIVKVLKSENNRVILGESAYKMFKQNYDYNGIMKIWSQEYYKVIEIFESKGVEIEKKLKYYHLWFLFYRKVRKVIKFLNI